VSSPTVIFRRHAIDLSDPVNATDHVLGTRDAPVTVVEYGDFECPVCKQAAPTGKLLLERFPERTLFVFRHFPQEAVHPHALHAAEAAECAGAQGKFWPMHDLLFAHQDRLKPKDLHGYAERLELDMAQFGAGMDDEVYRQRIREQMEGGRRSHLKATPGFYVNGIIVDVSFGLPALFEAIAKVLG
jgi:protein-disulfide isomerase